MRWHPIEILSELKGGAGDMAVMVDSGFRRGTDILKAYALGADFVFVGRPFLYAAVVAGELGVRHAIALLAKEIDIDLALLGLREVGEIDVTRLRGIPPPSEPDGRGPVI